MAGVWEIPVCQIIRWFVRNVVMCSNPDGAGNKKTATAVFLLVKRDKR